MFRCASHCLASEADPQKEHNREWVASLCLMGGVDLFQCQCHTAVRGEEESSNWRYIWHKIDIYNSPEGIFSFLISAVMQDECDQKSPV